MKTVLITIPSAPLSQGFLRTDFLEELRRGDVKAVLLVPPAKRDYYANEYKERSEIEVVAAPTEYEQMEDRWHRLMRQSIPSTTIYNRQMHAFYSMHGISRWTWFILTRALWLLGHLRLWRELLRFLYRFSAYRPYLTIIDEYKPDLIFSTTLFDKMDLGLLKAAKRRGITTVGMPKSWDSMTSKCMIAIKPDYCIVQNEIVAEEVQTIGDIPKSRITVCGIPQFDFYFKTNLLKPRGEFLKQIGLAENDRYILFTGGGLALFPDECPVLAKVAEGMMDDPQLQGFKLVYRPHPNYAWCVDEAKQFANITTAVSYKPVAPRTGGWEFEMDDLQYLFNSLHHAQAVLHMASTIAIEAALVDAPMIGIASDGEKQKPFFLSAERYYSTSHYAHIVKARGTTVAKTVNEIMGDIRTYVENRSLDRDGRQLVAREEVVWTDGRSAARIAKRIREILKI